MKFQSLYSFQHLTFHLSASEKGLTGVNLVSPESLFESNTTNSLIEEAIYQLDEYFHLKRTSFSVEYDLKATDFQKKVWSELAKIPHGALRTYQEIAVVCGGKNYARAVAMACH